MTRKNRHRMRGNAAAVLCSLLLAMLSATACAETYRLIVQPIQSPEHTREAYAPLVTYLSAKTGADLELVTARNFVSYWASMRTGERYDLILDAAHFTDYRIQRMDFEPLAKVLNVVSFSLVTRDDVLLLSAKQLVGKPVAVLSSPSMGYVRLSQLFPNPMRQPVIVRVSDSQEAVEKVREGKATAAVIPTPLVGNYSFLFTVKTMEQVPHMALSASPDVPREVSEAIRRALINAADNPEGRRMLDAINLPGFEAANPQTYSGYAQLLKGVYGY